MVAAAVCTENNFEHHESSPSRGEVLARYRHLRQICKLHHSEALKFSSRHAILHQARRLGLADGKFFIIDSMDELTLAFDLAIHTAPAGRSRAIDDTPDRRSLRGDPTRRSCWRPCATHASP